MEKLRFFIFKYEVGMQCNFYFRSSPYFINFFGKGKLLNPFPPEFWNFALLTSWNHKKALKCKLLNWKYKPLIPCNALQEPYNIIQYHTLECFWPERYSWRSLAKLFSKHSPKTRPVTPGSGKNVTEEQGDSRGRIQTVVVCELPNWILMWSHNSGWCSSRVGDYSSRPQRLTLVPQYWG